MIQGSLNLACRLSLPVDHKKALLITPLPSAKSWDADSVDLRLGTNFILARSDRLAVNVPGHGGYEFRRRLHIPLGRYIVLPGHHTVLASTLEFIKLPYDLAAMILTKSSWARTFITMETAPWVHPCYRGCLTLEIANVSETPLALYPGLSVAQLVFAKVKGARCPERELSGSYVGPVRPEAPILKKPEQVLRDELNVSKEHIYRPWPPGSYAEWQRFEKWRDRQEEKRKRHAEANPRS